VREAKPLTNSLKSPASGLAKADEEPQIYLIPPDGGEARRLTDIATGCFGIKWFPDSRRIAFLSWVWPEEKGTKALAKRYRAWKDDPVKAHVVEHSAYRWWDKWLSDGRTPRLFTVDIDTGAVRDLFAGTKYELAQADPTAHLYDIAPDGREIVFSFDPAEEKRFDHSYQLVALDLRTRRFRTLTRNSPLNHETPRYSPDGRWIALITQDLRKSHIDTQRISLIDRRNGKMTVATSRWDRSVHPPLVWSAESTAILFVAEDQARQHLWRLRVGARLPEMAARGGAVSDFDVAADAVVFVRNNMSTPPQVFWSAAGMDERRIDSLNEGVLDGVKLGEVKDLRIQGFGRDPVQMWVIYPPDFDPKKKWPLLHNIHGGPHATWGDNFHFRWNNHVFAAQGYVVVCVNYHGSSSFGRKYMESIVGDLGRRELYDVERGTDFMLKQGYIDRDATDRSFYQVDQNGESKRAYRTGDLGRWLSSGDLELMGRKDRQVKLRGFRIELDEIESVIAEHHGLRDVAVVTSTSIDDDSTALIGCYFTCHGSDITEKQVREFARDRLLPQVLSLTRFSRLEQLPLTANGKVNRRELAALFESSETRSADAVQSAASTTVRRQILTMWEDLLTLEDVDEDINFFELGGDSMLAIRLLRRLREELHPEINLGDVYDFPTVSQLSARVSQLIA